MILGLRVQASTIKILKQHKYWKELNITTSETKNLRITLKPCSPCICHHDHLKKSHHESLMQDLISFFIIFILIPLSSMSPIKISTNKCAPCLHMFLTMIYGLNKNTNMVNNIAVLILNTRVRRPARSSYWIFFPHNITPQRKQHN